MGQRETTKCAPPECAPPIRPHTNTEKDRDVRLDNMFLRQETTHFDSVSIARRALKFTGMCDARPVRSGTD